VANGELVIEGESVAKGYLNQRQFHGRYRTGDLVEVRDGELVYLGRIDRQLKVNGIRIEPAEIEAAMRSHPDVIEAVVGLNNSQQLVGYYKSTKEIALSEYLESRSPVVPVILERRTEFPLNQNGKVQFDEVTTNLNKEERATETEERVRKLASEILNRPVPIQGPMGLDSLGLVILLDRIGRTELFDRAHEFAHEPTVKKIAAVLSSLDT
jgi:acyl-CoA synthetase (AMP-forming)/AMP-acid ligase II